MSLARTPAGLSMDGVPLVALAERYGTPLYVYSRADLEAAWHAFDAALGTHPHLVCYAVKANSNLAILALLARLGSGFDIVSGGELERVLAAGGDPQRVVFSGVGKSVEEMRQALTHDILCFNVESEAELDRLEAVAQAMGRRARVSLRVNPDVDPRTHPYISTGLEANKFGVPVADAAALYRRAATSRHLEVVGVDCHIGSQITELSPFVDALDRVLALVDELEEAGIPLRHLDVGGGLGIRYRAEQPPMPGEYAASILARLAARPLTLLLEPGRAIVGNAGVLLTRVEYLKRGQQKNFAIVDAGMNDLLRPALYEAYHEILPVEERDLPACRYDVVGPVCESSDFLGRDRMLAIAPGDLLAVLSAGAYGMSMSSNYNSRPRAAEVLIDGGVSHLIRRRETAAELFAHELPLPDLGSGISPAPK